MKDCQQADAPLQGVRRIVREALEGTSLRGHVARFGSIVGGGKMPRARLIPRVGALADVTPAILGRTAAVGMLHAASLLHDDILDGGTLRRGAPTFWVSEGTRSAIILAVATMQEVLPSHLSLLPSAAEAIA